SFNTYEKYDNTSFNLHYKKKKNYRGRTSIILEQKEPLVEILNWCLMPNHYQLCVQELVPGGIVKFLQKTMTGYTMYFNTKYQRSGVLFQGKTKSRHVDSDAYLRYLQYYID